MQARRPNFFVIGAPKCGTTTLHAWLSEHPDVFLPRVKEPHFFALLRHDRTTRTLGEYLDLYRTAGDRPAVGDGSTTYLHTPGALETLRSFAPQGRIVVLVRNPVDLVRSLHGYKVARGQEDEPDLERAWRLSPLRACGERLPPGSVGVDEIQVVYAEMGLLGKHVARLFELFDRAQVHVILFDDLASDPARTWRDLLAFLQLDDDGRTSFQARNATAGQEGRLVYDLAARLPRPVVHSLRRLGVGSSKIVALGRRSGEPPKARAAPRVAFVEELREWYRADVQLLGRTIGRDLSAWSEPAGEGR